MARLVKPIRPDQIASTTLTEYFVFSADACFSDSAGAFTTPATIGGAVGSVKARAQRAETLIQTTSADQPLLVTEPTSGHGALQFNATSNYLNRSYKGTVGSCLLLYAANMLGHPDGLGDGIKDFQTIMAQPSSGSNYHIFMDVIRPFATAPAADCFLVQLGRTDNSTQPVMAPAQLGAPDAVLFRTDGTNSNLCRNGVMINSSVVTNGVARAAPDGVHSIVGATISNTGAVSNYYLGDLIGFVTFSGYVSDAEMPGLMEWAKREIAQTQASRFLGFYFQGGVGVTLGTINRCLVAATSDDGINFRNRPIAGMPNGFGLSSGVLMRDMGVVSIGSTVFVAHTSMGGGNTALNSRFDIHKCTDQMNVDYMITVDCSAVIVSGANSACWAPEFIKNQDGSMWVGSDGLPVIVFSGSPDTNADFQLYMVKPLNQTWINGGAWGVPFAVTKGTGFPNNAIDPSIIVVGGTFYLFYSNEGSTAYIAYATATSYNGPYTPPTNAVDPFSFGSPFEAPQCFWLGGNDYIIHIDQQGAGWFWALSTTGPGGPYSTKRLVNCPWTPQHGNMVPMPQGWDVSDPWTYL